MIGLRSFAIALLFPLTAAVPASPTRVAVPAQHRLIEGIATDGRTIWVSSIIDRTIVADTDGAQRMIAMPPGAPHPMAMAWDAARRWLWIAADCPDVPGVERCDAGALLALDRRGRKRAYYQAAAPFHPGDVSVGGGEVFVSDSGNGAVYRLRNGARSLEMLVPPHAKGSAQGSTTDGRGWLIVSDYGNGLVAVDLASGRQTPLPRADGKPFAGIDGLVRAGDRYFGIYNGDSPGALVSFTIDDNTLRDVVIRRGAPFVDPTQLAIRRGQLIIVADSGWAGIARATPVPRGPIPIVTVPLS